MRMSDSKNDNNTIVKHVNYFIWKTIDHHSANVGKFFCTKFGIPAYPAGALFHLFNKTMPSSRIFVLIVTK